MVTYTSSGGSFTLHNPIQYWNDYSYDSYGERGARLGSFNKNYHVAVMTESVFNGPLVAWLFRQDGDTVTLVDEARVAQPVNATNDWDNEPTHGIWSFDDHHMIYVANLGWSEPPWMALLKRDGDSIYWADPIQLTEVGPVEYSPLACTIDGETALVAFGGNEHLYLAEIDRYGDDLYYGIHVDEDFTNPNYWLYRTPVDLLKLEEDKILLITQWDNSDSALEASIYSKRSMTWQRLSHGRIRGPVFVTEDSWETGGGTSIVGDRVVTAYTTYSYDSNTGIYKRTVDATSFSIAGDMISDSRTSTIFTFESTVRNQSIYGLWGHGWSKSGPLTATWYVHNESGVYVFHMVDISVDDIGEPVIVSNGVEIFDQQDFGLWYAFAPNITGVEDSGIAVWVDTNNWRSIAAVLLVPEDVGAPCIQVPESIDMDGTPFLRTSLEEES